MDFYQRTFKNQSFQLIAKSLVAVVVLSACATSHKRTILNEAESTLKTLQVKLGLRLTSLGNNEEPRFSPDGERVLFVSSQRETHSNAQIYELNLDNYTERRITYQNGECRDPLYTNDGKMFLYGSTTDEIKERPALIYGQQKTQWPPTEIYRSDLTGMKIERLTYQPGFQGLFNFATDKDNQLIFSSEKNGNLVLQLLDLKSRATWIGLGLPKAKMEYGLMLLNGGFLWTQKSPDQKTSQILTRNKGGKIEALALKPSLYQDLTWWDRSSEKLLVSAIDTSGGEPVSQILILDLRKKCQIKLFDDGSKIRYPQVSHRRKKILFASDSGGKYQLYLRDIPDSLFECKPF